MAGMSNRFDKLYKTEDWWSVWLGLGIVFLALVTFWTGSTIKGWAVTPAMWSDLSSATADLAGRGGGYLTILVLLAAVGVRSVLPVHRSIYPFCRPLNLRNEAVLGVHHRGHGQRSARLLPVNRGFRGLLVEDLIAERSKHER
jgi:hypothetical protein